MAYEGLKDNRNAEKWSEEKALELFEKAIEIAEAPESDFDFIGEVTRELRVSRFLLINLAKKFPSCKDLYSELKSYVESNCFSNGKRGNINTAMAIVNLKSNHGWTDKPELEKDKEPKPAQFYIIDPSKNDTTPETSG